MKKLSVKIIISVGLILFVTEGIRTYVIMKTYRRQIINEKVKAVALQSDIIKKSLVFAMMRNSWDEGQKIIEFVQKEKGIEKIRIFDKEGKILVSADKKDVGKMIDKKAEACYRCHGEEERTTFLAVNDRARFFQTEEGEKVIGLMNPIYNNEACSSCHDPQKRILGVLDIVISLDDMKKATVGHTKEMLIPSFIALAMISLAIAVLILILVNRPIKKLMETMSRMKKGDFAARVNIRSGDELEELGHSFNSMTASLQQRTEELVRANEKLKMSNAQIIQSGKLAALGELGAGVAHELNNPVGGILGYAQYMLEKVRSPHFQAEDFKACDKYLGYIEKEAERCKTIVANLLKFSRRSAEEFEPVKVNQVIEDTLALIGHQLMMKKIELKKELAPDLRLVEGNANQLQQVFTNIILNAQQAMPEGGALTIATQLKVESRKFKVKDEKLSPETNFIEIRFTDMGSGISPGSLDRIFDPFFTTKTGREGTGLGLSVSYEIIRNHKGQIQVKSEVGKGTTFTVILPVKE